MASPACASGSFQAGQGQYAGDEGGVNAAQLGMAIDAARTANMNIRRIGFPNLVARTCVLAQVGSMSCFRSCRTEVRSGRNLGRGEARAPRRGAASVMLPPADHSTRLRTEADA